MAKKDELPGPGPPVIWPEPPPSGEIPMPIPDILEWVEWETRMGGELSADLTMRLKRQLAEHGGEPTERHPPSPPTPPPSVGPQSVEEAEPKE